MEQMKAAIKGMLVVALGMAAAAGASPQASPSKHASASEQQRVDINRASLEELIKVPGMTRTWAGRIVRFRPYRNKLELLDQGIVSGEVYNRIKDYVIAHRKNSDQ